MNAIPKPKILPPEWLKELGQVVTIDGRTILIHQSIFNVANEVRLLLDEIQGAEEGTIFPWNPLFSREVLSALSAWCQYDSMYWDWQKELASASVQTSYRQPTMKNPDDFRAMGELFRELKEVVETKTFLVTPDTIGPIDGTWAQKVATVTAVEVTESMLNAGESTVLTVNTVLADGSTETRNMAQVGDWLVTNPGGETYVVSAGTFKETYKLVDGDTYRSKDKPRLIGSPAILPARMAFHAPWGLMYGQRGDLFVLSTEQTSDGEIVATPSYIINRQAFVETYREMDELGDPVSNVTMMNSLTHLSSGSVQELFEREIAIRRTA